MVKKSNFWFFILCYLRGFFSVLRFFFFRFIKFFNCLKTKSFKNDNLIINVKLSNSNKNFFLSTYLFKLKWLSLYDYFLFIYFDYVLVYFMSLVYDTQKFVNFRISHRLKQVKWNFYLDFFNDFGNKNFFNVFFFNYLSGLRYLWLSVRFWLFGVVLFLVVFYYLMYVRLLPFNKVAFEWFLIIMFLYWLMSGFVFFIKKYQYGKFTAAIQRFWKRSYILFWIIETGTFCTFFYLTLNASEEPVYMYDQIKVFKTHLFSWRMFLPKTILIIALIVFGYIFNLSLKWNVYSKQSLIVFVLTLLIIYVVWLEFYQFFHIINFYGNLVWVYDYDEFLWNLELEFRRTRMANNYIAICLMAKFWHLVFIFVFWVFFVLRVNEIKRIRYPLYSANFQNFVILYILTWLYMYPWFKFVYRKFLDVPYFWFFYSGRRLFFRCFFTDIKLLYFSIFSNLWSSLFGFLNNFRSGLFFYWFESSVENGFYQYRKSIVRDYIISSINNSNAACNACELCFVI
jgi:hypothetical protein